MIEPDTVRRLLEVIEQRLRNLKEIAGTTVEAYVADPKLQAQVERHLEVMIQACIDLGMHVLSDLPAPMPDTNRGVFTALRNAELLDESLCERLVDMAGFRYVLAHGYVDIDPKLVHAHLSHQGDAKAMVEALSPYLREQGAL